MIKKLIIFSLMLLSGGVQAQEFLQVSKASQQWADSVYKKLNRREKIAQLMVLRLSERSGDSAIFYTKEVSRYIQKYNIGSICLFQGKAIQQALTVNQLQQQARTPLMVCIDGETGVGMRFDDILRFPNQLTLGAVANADLAYQMGHAMGIQCKRAGIQVNYAPVVDINNNPANPVINVRSFGESKYKVARFGIALTQGMQQAGVMACAKHFPGHGDVSVDSHYDLPVIPKSKLQLDSLEIYPFKEMIKAGVGSMMMGHLYIPAIDATVNQASSLSKKNVTDLVRNDLGFKGINFTDALEMKGVAKFYPQGEAAAQSLIAGNDMLCLPGDIKGSIKRIRKAIRKKELSWEDIQAKVNRVLIAKYNLGLYQVPVIDTINLVNELNELVVPLKKEIYKQAITVLKQTDSTISPLNYKQKIAFVGVGLKAENHFSELLKNTYTADSYCLPYDATEKEANVLLQQLQSKYDVMIIGVHQYTKYPANNFGISQTAINFIKQVNLQNKAINIAFGTPYAMSNFTDLNNLVAAYEDDKLMHEAVLSFLKGEIKANGTLPVSIGGGYHFGFGIANK
ncbi:glycoside hydrolase family 3 protein [Pedobacter glucosidilyticus]|uniref:glycoside hydrolase family 3 protein n=1 Tax=Pedobacter glucosidilyticus TaxID=1122941 RepID=UPI0004037CD4|nr:glycoside hydrolase family 3 N-terminal domain-containing protein [Pedobacter glucosidilyticus]